MNNAKCPGIYHKESMQPAPFKFCQECGAVVNPKARPDEKCFMHHTLRKTNGYKFCPDCGEQLRK
jgi:rRNA maturation endonuclease Nob1